MISCDQVQFDEYERITKFKSEMRDSIGNYVSINSEIIDLREDIDIDYVGHCWSLAQEPTIQSNYIERTFEGDSNLLDTLYNIVGNKVYYCRAYSRSGNIINYGRQIKIQASPDTTFNIKYVGYEVLDEESVNIFVDYLGIGSMKDSISGCYIALDSLFTDTFQHIQLSPLTNMGTQVSYITNLDRGVKFYIKTYIYLDNNTYKEDTYREIYINKNICKTLGYVIDNNKIYVEGEITEIGIKGVENFGFCYSWESSNPSYNDQTVNLGNTYKLGLYNADFTIPAGVETIYYRSFISDGEKLDYGEIKIIEL